MAKVLTGISGNLISAASAGFAPTNKADVSAIASAYQVVSATATQLYAGTAYVTSVNGAPFSASRAGNAANASLANSAWYDGTGRLISSLPDSASVSAIASAYAESAASSKQDELTFSYDDDKISAINGSALAGQGGGELVTSIQSALDPWYQTSISGLNGSSLYPKWAKSALSAQSAFTADWARVALSASAAPTAWASSFITGVSSPSGTIRVLGGTAIESTNSAVLPSTVIEGFSTSYDGDTTGPDKKLHCVLPTANPSTEIIMPFYYGSGVVLWSSDNGIEGSQEKDHFPETITAQVPNATAVDIWADSWILVDSVTASAVNQEIGGGVAELAWASALPTYSYDAEDKISAINGSAIAGGGGGGATGDYVEKSATNLAIGSSVDAQNDDTFAQGRYCSSNYCGLAQGYHNRASSMSFAQGTYNNANIDAFAQGSDNTANSNGFAQGYKNTGSGNSFAQGNRSLAKACSFAQGDYSTASGVSFAQGSGVSAIDTAVAFGTYNLSGNGSDSTGAAFVLGDGTASSDRHDLMVVTKDGEITMYSGTADTTGTGIMSSIRAISAAATGGAGVEYSGIAPIHVDNDTHEISADVVNMDLQQITHDDTMVHVSNSASYALGVNYNYSGAPWNEGLVLKSGLLYSNNNPATGITSYALSDNVSSYYKLDVNFYDINDWHTRMECLIPSGILPSGARGGYFNAVANLPNNVWFKCFRWSAIGTNWYCQVDEIAGTNGTNTPTFNVNQNLNPPKVLSIVGWYKDSI